MTELPDQDALVRIRHRAPTEVCVGLDLDEAAQGFLKERLGPSQFLGRLIQGECFRDAVQYLAHALSRADAVAWACLSVRTALGENLAPAVAEALGAAEAWVNDPVEVNCRRAEAAATAVSADKSGAEFAALAAFWCGDNMAPEGLPPVAPPPQLIGIAVSSAVTLAATCGAPEKIPERYRAFLSRGILIARAPLSQ
jgi:hypothetical protein